MSTRVEGAESPVIVITAKANLVAGATCLVLTVWQENGNLWRYTCPRRPSRGTAAWLYGTRPGAPRKRARVSSVSAAFGSTAHTSTKKLKFAVLMVAATADLVRKMTILCDGRARIEIKTPQFRYIRLHIKLRQYPL